MGNVNRCHPTCSAPRSSEYNCGDGGVGERAAECNCGDGGVGGRGGTKGERQSVCSRSPNAKIDRALYQMGMYSQEFVGIILLQPMAHHIYNVRLEG